METRIYINMDRSLIKKGGRRGERISEEELLRKVLTMQRKYSPDGMTADFDGESPLEMVFVEELLDNCQISKDLSKIKFSTENCIANPDEWEGESLIGLHTLPNGLTFLGVVLGGDWEVPLFAILYWSGSSLRAYIPSYGNTFNPDFKTAFGSEGANRSVKNEEIFIKSPYSGCEQFEAGQRYLRSVTPIYKQVDIQPDINWEAIKEDIEGRIEIL